jgi:hypothetical protein
MWEAYMGSEALRRGVQASDREKARRKNFRSDLARIFAVLAFALFIGGFSAVSAPVPTATVMWIIAGFLLIGAAVCSAINLMQ